MLTLPQFVFINGPAGSGKSTLSDLICSKTSACWPEAFAEPIRDMIQTVFFPNDGPVSYSFNLKDGEVKRKNLLALAGLVDPPEVAQGPTVRQAMIEFSQGYMKSCFGENIFGKLLWRRCQEQSHWYSHFVIDDSGFLPEAQYIINEAGADECLLIRLHRKGVDFSGDSRGYIDLPIRTIDLHNDGPALEMIDELELALGSL